MGIGMAVALLVAAFRGSVPVGMIYAAVSVLFVISAWQLVSFVNNLSLKGRFIRSEDAELEDEKLEFPARETKELLPEADLKAVVPASITERSTRKLKQRLPDSKEKPD